MENYERTLVVIEPDAMRHRDAIIRRIEDAGFTIIQSRVVQLSPEQAAEFYRRMKDDPNYYVMSAILSEGPILAMCVSKPYRAVTDMLWLIGPAEDATRNAPGSLRALFGDDRDVLRKVIHASADTEQARFEIRFFFPSLTLEPIFCEQSLDNYLRAMVNPVLMEGLYLMAIERPQEDLLVWLAHWLKTNNPYKAKVDSVPPELVDHQALQSVEACEGEPLGSHMGAQSMCECVEFAKNGLCLCSLSEIQLE
ncbi:nucleoside diphosphate kinase homolog 5 [Toxorhynchites rutilus septentrionalis]|uniref:nucleoside diphosphate kinase homolog 5 n=1 Tax=Toxorhynchites rutilus septentrionalis TaxID=329112 RepID=UPI00247A8EF1|nr:nucleoside diphosphate kinase homolog 5 [Toxorhynchites rutilus septentrionalis]